MSYSRWSNNSDWYTFWRCQDEATENLDTALFEIMCVATFTAKQLRDDLGACMDQACAESGHDRTPNREELEGFVAEFLSDVEAEYPRELVAHD